MKLDNIITRANNDDILKKLKTRLLSRTGREYEYLHDGKVSRLVLKDQFLDIESIDSIHDSGKTFVQLSYEINLCQGSSTYFSGYSGVSLFNIFFKKIIGKLQVIDLYTLSDDKLLSVLENLMIINKTIPTDDHFDIYNALRNECSKIGVEISIYKNLSDYDRLTLYRKYKDIIAGELLGTCWYNVSFTYYIPDTAGSYVARVMYYDLPVVIGIDLVRSRIIVQVKYNLRTKEFTYAVGKCILTIEDNPTIVSFPEEIEYRDIGCLLNKIDELFKQDDIRLNDIFHKNYNK